MLLPKGRTVVSFVSVFLLTKGEFSLGPARSNGRLKTISWRAVYNAACKTLRRDTRKSLYSKRTRRAGQRKQSCKSCRERPSGVVLIVRGWARMCWKHWEKRFQKRKAHISRRKNQQLQKTIKKRICPIDSSRGTRPPSTFWWSQHPRDFTDQRNIAGEKLRVS